MNRFFILTLFLLNSIAVAQTTPRAVPESIVPEGISLVNAKTLVRIGAGIQDETTQNWIQLACVGKSTDPNSTTPNCNLLKFVLFKIDSDEAYYFGMPIVVHKKIRKDVKRDIQNFVEAKRKHPKLHKVIYNGVLFVEMAGSMFCFATFLPFNLVFPAIIAMDLAEGFKQIYSKAAAQLTSIGKGVSKMTTAMTEYNDNPELMQMKHERFMQFLNFEHAESLNELDLGSLEPSTN